MGHRKNTPATRHPLLEFYHRLWTMSADGGVCSRTGCPAWVYPRIFLHGPTPFLPNGRGGSVHARPWISAEDLDSSEISVRHLIVVQSDMVSKLMDHRVTDLVNDFGLRPAKTQYGASIDGDTGGELTSRLKK